MDLLKVNVVEDCFRLCIGDFGRGLLNRAKALIPEPEKSFYIHHGLSKVQVSYTVSKQEGIAQLALSTCAGESWSTQVFELDYSIAHFGLRPFFVCFCDRRVATLFLRPGYCGGFACRECCGLRYEVKTINKSTPNGKVWYYANRMRKLMLMEANLKRRYCSNRITRQFQSFAKGINKWQVGVQELEKHQEAR